MARETITFQPYIDGFLELMGDEGSLATIIPRLQSLLEGGDFGPFCTHLIASIPPLKDRRQSQISSALFVNVENGRIFLARGENPRHSFQQALNCLKALLSTE